nr:hypothetical protein CFP56_21944 [Quercus suber]
MARLKELVPRRQYIENQQSKDPRKLGSLDEKDKLFRERKIPGSRRTPNISQPRTRQKLVLQAYSSQQIKIEDVPQYRPLRARPNAGQRPILEYQLPGTVDGRLQYAFLEAVDDLNLQNSWVAFAIPRIGTNPVIDTAAKAVVQAHIHATHSPTSKPRAGENTSYYLQAITSLRENLVPADQTLIAVALLALYETVLRGADHDACTQHWMGVAAIALAKGRKTSAEEWSEAARAILTEYWVCLGSRTACAIGIPSPFDNTADGWLDIDPIFGGPDNEVPYDTVKLRKHSHGHYIRFPRLLAMLRSLRQHRDPDAHPQVNEIIELARELLHNGNHEAESKMLHRVQVTRTLDATDREVTLYSYHFRSEGEVSSCVLYWQSRLSTIKCCLMINEVLNRSPTPFDTESLEKEQARIATNIIMSWQDGFKRDIFGRYMSQAIFVTHLALKNFKTFRGKPTSHTRNWLLKCFHKAAEADWPGLEPTEEEMDETTDWVAGGTSTGFFGAYAVRSPSSDISQDADEQSKT